MSERRVACREPLIQPFISRALALDGCPVLECSFGLPPLRWPAPGARPRPAWLPAFSVIYRYNHFDRNKGTLKPLQTPSISTRQFRVLTSSVESLSDFCKIPKEFAT